MITLPFPPARLSPNARCHWAQKAKTFKAYKFQCLALLSQFRATLHGRCCFAVTFHPPSARRFDMDGLISRFKAGQDALAEVCGVNDYHFIMTYSRGEPRENGAVVLS